MAENCTVNTTEDKLFLDTGNTAWISEVVSLLFLLVILVVEIYYICRYKSNFTFRLLFYITVVTIAVIVSFIVEEYLMLLCYTTEPHRYPYLSIGVSTYIQYIEIMLFFSIQVTLVTKIYASIADGRRNSLRSLGSFCSRHPKRSEAMFVVVHIILPVPLLIGFVANGLFNKWKYFESISIYLSSPRHSDHHNQLFLCSLAHLVFMHSTKEESVKEKEEASL